MASHREKAPLRKDNNEYRLSYDRVLDIALGNTTFITHNGFYVSGQSEVK